MVLSIYSIQLSADQIIKNTKGPKTCFFWSRLKKNKVLLKLKEKHKRVPLKLIFYCCCCCSCCCCCYCYCFVVAIVVVIVYAYVVVVVIAVAVVVVVDYLVLKLSTQTRNFLLVRTMRQSYEAQNTEMHHLDCDTLFVSTKLIPLQTCQKFGLSKTTLRPHYFFFSLKSIQFVLYLVN